MAKQTELAKEIGHGMHRPGQRSENSGSIVNHQRSPEDAGKDSRLLHTVEGRMNSLRDMMRDTDREPAEEIDTDDDSTLEGDGGAEARDGSHAVEDQADSPDDDDTSTLDRDADDGEEEHKLPAAYERAAIGWGWKKEDVRDFFQADPERALRTFANIYESRNRASADFSALGQKAIEDRRAEQQREAKPAFPTVDASKLREQYGEEAAPLIEMLEAQNKAMAQLAERMPQDKGPASGDRYFDSRAEESALEQQIWNFFQSDTMTPWSKIYGKLGVGETEHDLSPSQRDFRYKVLEKADQFAAGAKLQGRDVSLEEALEAAHLLVTQRYRDEIIIDDLKSKAVQRSKGITVRPSKGKMRPGRDVAREAKPGNRTREQLESDVQSKLNKMYGGR